MYSWITIKSRLFWCINCSRNTPLFIFRVLSTIRSSRSLLTFRYHKAFVWYSEDFSVILCCFILGFSKDILENVPQLTWWLISNEKVYHWMIVKRVNMLYLVEMRIAVKFHPKLCKWIILGLKGNWQKVGRKLDVLLNF